MKTEPVCFVDFGLEHITLCVCFVEDSRIIEIPFLETEYVKIPLQRIQSPLNQIENFDMLVKLIDKAEKQLKISISSIIFTIKEKSIQHFVMRATNEFKSIQKISRMTMEKLAKQTIYDFCKEQIDNFNILDFMKHCFVLDKSQTFQNPYKIKCKTIELRSSIIAIKRIFTKSFGEYLEKYKIHSKHYISPTVGVFNIAKEQLNNGNVLLIDIGSCSTEFLVIHKGIILMKDIINIGGLDITRDIADVMKMYILDADTLKCRLKNNFGITDQNSEVERINHTATTIADARMNEIALCIAKEIKNKYKKIAFNKVVLCGGSSKYKNTNKIFQNHFETQIETINKKLILTNQYIRGRITEEQINQNNVSLFGSISFYLSNQEIYKNAKHGFIFSIGSRISCFLKDLLY